MDQAAAVRVRESDLDLLALDRAEGIQEVIDVEADLDLLAVVVHLDLILGLFLLRVVRLDGEKPRAGRQPDAPILLVREDGGPLEGKFQRFTLSLYGFGRIRGYYAAVLRETTVDQLRSEANVADLGSNVITSDPELDVSLRPEDPLQLEDPFSGHDHLLAGLCLPAQLRLAEREPMPVGRHRAQCPAVGLEQ